MEQVIQILTWIWDALNSAWFWGGVAIIGWIGFLVLYFITNRMVDKYRAEILQEEIDEANAEHVCSQQKEGEQTTGKS